MIDETEQKRRQSLPEIAKNALKEADERKARAEKQAAAQHPKEQGGPKGEEPTRFGDWERDGHAVDF